jgi:hypothetical protein
MINPVSTDTKKTKLSEDDIPIIKEKSNYLSKITAILQSKMLVSD